MKNKVFKILPVFITIAILICSVFVFAGCDKDNDEEPAKKNYYEIRLYDDDWNELKREFPINESGYYDYCGLYEYEYDGEVKGFNARAFKNGVQFYELFYKNKYFSLANMVWIDVCTDYNDLDQVVNSYNYCLPKEKGTYTLNYYFAAEWPHIDRHEIFENDNLGNSRAQRSVTIKII